MELDHITKEDKETERIKKNARARKHTPKAFRREQSEEERCCCFFGRRQHSFLRTFFTECCVYKRQRIPLKGHPTAQSLEEKTNEEKQLLFFTLNSSVLKAYVRKKTRGGTALFSL